MPNTLYVNLSTDDIRELLVVLNVALVDTTEAIRNAPDESSTTHLKDHREIIREWIHRLSIVTQS